MTFHILGMSSSQLTFIFFRGVGIPPTSHAIPIIFASEFPWHSHTKKPNKIQQNIRNFHKRRTDGEKLLQARFLQWYTCWRDMKIDVQPSPQPGRVGRDNGNSRTLTHVHDGVCTCKSILVCVVYISLELIIMVLRVYHGLSCCIMLCNCF